MGTKPAKLGMTVQPKKGLRETEPNPIGKRLGETDATQEVLEQEKLEEQARKFQEDFEPAQRRAQGKLPKVSPPKVGRKTPGGRA